MPPPQQPRRPFTTSSLTNSIKSTIASQPLLSNLTNIDKLSSQASNLAQKAPFFNQINQQFQQHQQQQQQQQTDDARSLLASGSNEGANSTGSRGQFGGSGGGGSCVQGNGGPSSSFGGNNMNSANNMLRGNQQSQQQPAASKPLQMANTPTVDMSHLTEAERIMIQSVMAKAEMADMGIPVDTSTPSSTNLPSQTSQILSEQTRLQQQMAKQQQMMMSQNNNSNQNQRQQQQMDGFNNVTSNQVQQQPQQSMQLQMLAANGQQQTGQQVNNQIGGNLGVGQQPNSYQMGPNGSLGANQQQNNGDPMSGFNQNQMLMQQPAAIGFNQPHQQLHMQQLMLANNQAVGQQQQQQQSARQLQHQTSQQLLDGQIDQTISSLRANQLPSLEQQTQQLVSQINSQFNLGGASTSVSANNETNRSGMMTNQQDLSSFQMQQNQIKQQQEATMQINKASYQPQQQHLQMMDLMNQQQQGQFTGQQQQQSFTAQQQQNLPTNSQHQQPTTSSVGGSSLINQVSEQLQMVDTNMIQRTQPQAGLVGPNMMQQQLLMSQDQQLEDPNSLMQARCNPPMQHQLQDVQLMLQQQDQRLAIGNQYQQARGLVNTDNTISYANNEQQQLDYASQQQFDTFDSRRDIRFAIDERQEQKRCQQSAYDANRHHQQAEADYERAYSDQEVQFETEMRRSQETRPLRGQLMDGEGSSVRMATKRSIRRHDSAGTNANMATASNANKPPEPRPRGARRHLGQYALGEERRNFQAYDLAAPTVAPRHRVRQLPRQPAGSNVPTSGCGLGPQQSSVEQLHQTGDRTEKPYQVLGNNRSKQTTTSVSADKRRETPSTSKAATRRPISQSGVNKTTNSNNKRHQSTGSSRDYPTDSDNLSQDEFSDEDEDNLEESDLCGVDEEETSIIYENEEQIVRMKRANKSMKASNQVCDPTMVTSTAKVTSEAAHDNGQQSASAGSKTLIDKSEKALKLLSELKLTEQANQVMEQQQLLIKQSQELIKLQQAQLEKQQTSKEQKAHASERSNQVELVNHDAPVELRKTEDETRDKVDEEKELNDRSKEDSKRRSDDGSGWTDGQVENEETDDKMTGKFASKCNSISASAKPTLATTVKQRSTFVSLDLDSDSGELSGARRSQRVSTHVTAQKARTHGKFGTDEPDVGPQVGNNTSGQTSYMTSNNNSLTQPTVRGPLSSRLRKSDGLAQSATPPKTINRDILQSPTDTTDSDVELSISMHSTGTGSLQHQSHHSRTSRQQQQQQISRSSRGLLRRREPTGLPPSPLPVAAAIQLHQMQQQHIKNQLNGFMGRPIQRGISQLRSRSVTTSPNHLYERSGYLNDQQASSYSRFSTHGNINRRPGSPDTLSEYGGQRHRKRLPEPPQNAVPITPSMVRKMIQAQKAAASVAASSGPSSHGAVVCSFNSLSGSGGRLPTSVQAQSTQLANSANTIRPLPDRQTNTNDSILYGAAAASVKSQVHPMSLSTNRSRAMTIGGETQTGLQQLNLSPLSNRLKRQQTGTAEMNKFLTSTYGNSILKSIPSTTSSSTTNTLAQITSTVAAPFATTTSINDVDETPELDKLISNLDEYYGLSSATPRRQVRLAPLTTHAAHYNTNSSPQHNLYGTSARFSGGRPMSPTTSANLLISSNRPKSALHQFNSGSTNSSSYLMRRNSDQGAEMSASNRSNLFRSPLYRQTTSATAREYHPTGTQSSSLASSAPYSSISYLDHSRQSYYPGPDPLAASNPSASNNIPSLQSTIYNPTQSGRLSPYSSLITSRSSPTAPLSATYLHQTGAGSLFGNKTNLATSRIVGNHNRNSYLDYNSRSPIQRFDVDASRRSDYFRDRQANYQPGRYLSSSAAVSMRNRVNDCEPFASGITTSQYHSSELNRQSLLANHLQHRSVDLDTRDYMPTSVNLSAHESYGLNLGSTINDDYHHRSLTPNLTNRTKYSGQALDSINGNPYYQQQQPSTSLDRYSIDTVPARIKSTTGSGFAPFTKDDIIRNGPKFNSMGYRFRTENQNKYVADARAPIDCLQTKYMHPYKRILLSKNPKDRIGNGIGVRIIGGQPMPNLYDKVNKCIITSGAFVTEVFQSNNVYLMDELHEGDQIIEWNGVNLCNRSDEEVQQILLSQFSDDEVEIVYLNRDKFHEVYGDQEAQQVNMNRIGFQQPFSQAGENSSNDQFEAFLKLHKSSQFSSHGGNRFGLSSGNNNDSNKGSFRQKL